MPEATITDLMAGVEEIKKITGSDLAEMRKTVESLQKRGLTLDESIAQIHDNHKALMDKMSEKEQDNEAIRAEMKAEREAREALEVKFNSPNLPTGDDDNGDDAIYRKALHSYLMNGKSELGPEEIKVLRTDNDTGAGYLVRGDFGDEIIKGIREYSPIRQYARVITTGSKEWSTPTLATSVTAVWEGEYPSTTESTGPTYGMVKIPTHKIRALSIVTTEQMEDSYFDIEAELSEEHMKGHVVLEGTAFVSGAGPAQPEGFLTNADVGTTTCVTSGSGVLDSADDLILIQHAIIAEYSRNAVWGMNRTTLGVVRMLKNGMGGYLWIDGVGTASPTILGRPYFEATDMPAIASSAYPIVYGDFRRGYYIVDRVGMTVQRLDELYAANDAVGFYTRRRVGGQVVLPEAIRKLAIK